MDSAIFFFFSTSQLLIWLAKTYFLYKDSNFGEEIISFSSFPIIFSIKYFISPEWCIIAKKHTITSLNPSSPPTLCAIFFDANFFWKIFNVLMHFSSLNNFNSSSINLFFSSFCLSSKLSKLKFFLYKLKISTKLCIIFSLSLKSSFKFNPSLNKSSFNNSWYFSLPSLPWGLMNIPLMITAVHLHPTQFTNLVKLNKSSEISFFIFTSLPLCNFSLNP